MAEDHESSQTLNIRCPSCRQRFNVGRELMNRMVECGGCDSRFRIDDDVIIRTKKFYPGERTGTGLSRFQRVPLSAGRAPEGMETMRYQEFNNPETLEPLSPQRVIAGIFGVGLMILIGLLLLLSSNPGGAFAVMPLENKLVIAGFSSLLGVSLLVYANPRGRGKALLIGLGLAGAVVAVPFFVKGNPLGAGDGAEPLANRDFGPLFPEEELAPADALRKKYLTRPVDEERERLIEEGSTAQAYGVFITGIKERNKYTARDFLIRETGAGVSSHLYPRDESNYLMLLTDVEKDIGDVALIAGKLGRTLETHPEIGVVVVSVDNEQFVSGAADKLNDKTDPAFYDLNLIELKSIDLDRVRKAVDRLVSAEPSILRTDITRILTELLTRDGVTFHDSIARALITWAEQPGPAADAALTVLKRYGESEQTAPEGLVALVAKGGNPEAIPTLVSMWTEKPILWDSHLEKFGTPIEPFVLEQLHAESSSLQRSAIKLLEEVGTERSLGPLESLLDSKDPEVRVLAERALRGIRER